MLAMGKTHQKKKTEVAHALIVQGLNGVNVLVYFLSVCFLYDGTVYNISNLSFALKNDVNITSLYHLTFSISFKVAAPHSTASHCYAWSN